MSQAERDWLDSAHRKYMATQPAPEHCGEPAAPIGGGRYECLKDDAVFGVDYTTGDVGWKTR
ncbi:hypothetical protein [Streptomyces sp. CC224B]|uniref:hypothetical protein n=1 Tax=Streptomyces sp. CC224B TaxID=3044571 RepID=UPI0024A9BFE4|nr:hypothetical protein [Streptomyces sp. CC224B]